MPNPFGTTFESLENPAGPVVESVHEAPYRRLLELIDSGDGQLISLRAPRAGYGKTMLLSRLRDKKKASMAIIPIHLADGRRIEGESILEEVLTQLSESVPGASGLTKLDLHARRLFAHGLLPMVYSGEVPSQDKAGALDSLRERPTEAFDFHNEGAAIAQWTKSQFEVLSPRLASVLGKSSGASTRDTSYWIQLLSKFAVRTPSEASRTGDLMDAVFGYESRFRTGAGFLDGLGSLLNLITLVEPAVLILDEVDGLSSDADSALRATSSLVSLWESAPRTSVIISVNDDVWESAFAPRLPLGLRDRLEDVVIRLDSLSIEEAQALVKIRSGNHADKVLKELDLGSAKLYPRGVLRAAREAWSKCDFTAASPKIEKAPEAENQRKGPEKPVAEFSISASKESAQSTKSAQLSESEQSTSPAGADSPIKKASSSKILAGAAAVSSFVTGKARGSDLAGETKSDVNPDTKSEGQAKVTTPDKASSFGGTAAKTAEAAIETKVTKDGNSPFDAVSAKDANPTKNVEPAKPASSFEAAATKAAAPAKDASSFESTPAKAAAPAKDASSFESTPAKAAAPAKDASPFEATPAKAAAPAKDASPFEPTPAKAAAPAKDISPFESTPVKATAPAKDASSFEATPAKAAASSKDASPFESTPAKATAPAKDASPFEATPAKAATPAKDISPFESTPAKATAPAKDASPFEATPAKAAAPAKDASSLESTPAKAAAPAKDASSFESTPVKAVTPSKDASPFEPTPAKAVAPAKDLSAFEAALAKFAAPIADVSPVGVTPAKAAAPAKDVSPFEATPEKAASVEEIVVKDTVVVAPEKEASPFTSAPSKVTAPVQEIVMKETVASTHERSFPKEASSVPPIESAVKEPSPFEAAVPAQTPSPFEVATPVQTPSPLEAAAPVQTPSPFEAATTQAASPFQAQSAPAPAQAPAAVASPFQVAAAASPTAQSTLPPARPQAQHAPERHSPFEAAQAPTTAMDMAPVAPAAPYRNEPAPDDRRSQRVYPSKSPFDPALAKAALASAPVQAQGFSVPAAPSAPAVVAPAPPIFTAPANQAAPSPFQANLEAKPVPPQPNVPKADTDAIDELLRQFREHRDS